jgi:hypothetical protein
VPVCIAGIQYSGLSLVARLLALSGLDLGTEAVLSGPGDEENDAFAEDARFSALNTRILRALGGDWDLPPTPPEVWNEGAELEALGMWAKRLRAERDSAEHWGWKDPKNSLTLPFWQGLMPDLGVVICVRNPLDIAVSLRRFNYASYDMGLSLWLTYHKRLLAAVAGQRHLVIHQEALLANPRAEIERLVAFAELTPSAEMLARAETAVAECARSSLFTLDHLIELGGPDELLQLYSDLCAEAGWPPDLVGTTDAGKADNSKRASARPQVVPRPLDSQRFRFSVIEAERNGAEARQLQEACAGLQASVSHLNDVIATRDLVINDREMSIAVLREQLIAAQQETQRAAATVQEIVVDREHQIAQARLEVEHVRVQAAQEQGLLRDELARAMHEVGQEVERWHAKVAASDREVAAANQRLEVARRESATVGERIEHLGRQLEQIQLGIVQRDQIIAGLQAELEKARRSGDVLSEQAQARLEELDAARQRLKTITGSRAWRAITWYWRMRSGRRHN